MKYAPASGQYDMTPTHGGNRPGGSCGRNRARIFGVVYGRGSTSRQRRAGETAGRKAGECVTGNRTTHQRNSLCPQHKKNRPCRGKERKMKARPHKPPLHESSVKFAGYPGTRDQRKTPIKISAKETKTKARAFLGKPVRREPYTKLTLANEAAAYLGFNPPRAQPSVRR